MKKLIVYADVLVFINTIITYFLLLSVCAVFKKRVKTFRLILGAVFGGFCSLTIFLPPINFLLQVVVKAIICCGISFITFSFKNKIYFLKRCGVLLAVTFVFGGLVLTLISVFDIKSFAYFNGVAYFDISPIVLVMSTAVCYLAITLFYKFKAKTVEEKLIFECEIVFKNAVVKVNAVNDTGNSLLDPFFNSPVAIVEKQRLQNILLCKPKTYLIPIKSVEKSGVINAFRPDGFYIFNGKERRKVDDITIGISKQKLAKQFGAIISPKILEEMKEESLCLVSKK